MWGQEGRPWPSFLESQPSARAHAPRDGYAAPLLYEPPSMSEFWRCGSTLRLYFHARLATASKAGAGSCPPAGRVRQPLHQLEPVQQVKPALHLHPLCGRYALQLDNPPLPHKCPPSMHAHLPTDAPTSHGCARARPPAKGGRPLPACCRCPQKAPLTIPGSHQPACLHARPPMCLPAEQQGKLSSSRRVPLVC